MGAQLCKILDRHIFKYIKSFLDNSSLQGLKYVCDKSLSYWVRFYFAITFVVILSLAINLALNVYFRWESTPVIIGMSSSVTSIQSVPFPAITICNTNQARYSKVAHFQRDTLDYAMLQKLCFQELNYTKYEHLKPRTKRDTFENFIVRNAPSCSDMMIMCQYGPNRVPCMDIFREILLDEGMCCVFNLLHPHYLYRPNTRYIRDFASSGGQSDTPVDWNPVTGYSKNLPASYYPRRGLGTGVAMGLQIVLNGDIEDYFCSSTNGAGFKLLLYNAIDQPHIKESGLPIMLGYQTNFRIDVKSSEAMPYVRHIAREKRQCIFSDEQPLLFFRYYTRRNCEAECDAMYMLRTCDCVPYHLPKVFYNVTVCHVRHFACVAEIEMTSANDWQSLACKKACLSSCHDLTFFPTIFASPFAEQDYIMQNAFFNNFTKDFIRDNLASVNVYYAENFFRPNVKTPYTGLTEYMSLTGGIMSLMIGFSVISAAEIFYYAFIRPLFDFLQYHYRTHLLG